MSGVIIPAAELHELGLPTELRRGRQQLSIKCAACGEVIPELTLLADPAQLELHPAFMLCEPCYIVIRAGYQRDRDFRALSTYRMKENDLYGR